MTDLASKLHEAAKKNDSHTIVAMLSELATSGDATGMIAAVKEVAAIDTASSRYIAGHLEVSRDGDAFKVTVRPSGPPA